MGSSTGMRGLCILAAVLVAALPHAGAEAIPTKAGRKILQTCIDSFGACASWGPASCIYGGVPQYCPCMCGVKNPPAASPPPSPPTPTPTPPPPFPPSGCVDTNGACPVWGPSLCSTNGVPETCPCMCGRTGGTVSSPPPPTGTPSAPVPPGGATTRTSTGVSYHLYESANFPAIPEIGAAAQFLPGSNPGYRIDGLYCTDYMRNNPGIPWASVGWTATTGISSGLLKCGDRICIRNLGNGLTATAYVVDQGGKGSPTGFDLDYASVFSKLDSGYVNYQRGSMDIEWWKC